jgi:hypothetical protein
VSLRLCPADDRALRLLREEVVEFGSCLLCGDDDHLGPVQAPHQAVELLCDLLQMLVDERLDMTPEARLRPAALIVLSRLFLGVIGDFLEPSAPQSVELAALTAHDDDKCAFTASHERHEGRQIELPSHFHLIRNCLGQRQRPPDVVEAGAEDREAVGPVAGELALVVLPNAVEVVLHAQSLVMRELTAVGAVAFPSLVEERVQAGYCVRGRRRVARIEVEVQADCTALLGLEPCEITEFVPGDRSRQGSPAVLSGRLATYTMEHTTGGFRLLLIEIRNRRIVREYQ